MDAVAMPGQRTCHRKKDIGLTVWAVICRVPDRFAFSAKVGFPQIDKNCFPHGWFNSQFGHDVCLVETAPKATTTRYNDGGKHRPSGYDCSDSGGALYAGRQFRRHFQGGEVRFTFFAMRPFQPLKIVHL